MNPKKDLPFPVRPCQVAGRRAKTEDEAVENIREAIEEYLAAAYESVTEGRVREVEVAA